MAARGDVIKATVSAMYNVHLPKRLCDALSINEGDTIVFIETDQGYVVKKATVTVQTVQQ